MVNVDIRWQQRFANFLKALSQLEIFLQKDQLNDLEKQGIIQAFEYTYELAWNVLKDYLQAQGHQNLVGPRNAIQESFNIGIIVDSNSPTKQRYCIK